jgi:hypothetical protein
MVRKYLRVTPTSESLAVTEIPQVLASLHKLTTTASPSRRVGGTGGTPAGGRPTPTRFRRPAIGPSTRSPSSSGRSTASSSRRFPPSGSPTGRSPPPPGRTSRLPSSRRGDTRNSTKNSASGVTSTTCRRTPSRRLRGTAIPRTAPTARTGSARPETGTLGERRRKTSTRTPSTNSGDRSPARSTATVRTLRSGTSTPITSTS